MAKDLKVLFERELARIALPRDEALVMRAVEYEQGELRFDVRRFYTDSGGESRPTSKGASLKPEWVPEMRKALDAFEAEVRR